MLNAQHTQLYMSPSGRQPASRQSQSDSDCNHYQAGEGLQIIAHATNQSQSVPVIRLVSDASLCNRRLDSLVASCLHSDSFLK